MYVYNLFIYILRHDKGINPKKNRKENILLISLVYFFTFLMMLLLET